MQHSSSYPQNSNEKVGLFSCLLTEIYIVGTQKNHLSEMVLLSSHNIYFHRKFREIFLNNFKPPFLEY